MSSIASQVASLRAGILRALVSAEVSGTGILTAAVDDFRPLTWYAPAIYPYTDVGEQFPSVFSGFGFLKYSEAYGKPQKLYEDTLWQLQYAPLEVLSADGSYLQTPANAFNLEEAGRVVFSGPMLEDGQVGVDAAYTFALEFVAACVCAGMGKLAQSDSDFYIIGDGLRAGIRDGKLIQPGIYRDTTWEVNIRGMVEAYLTMSRGAGWTTHTLDVVDRMTFWYEGLTEMLPGLDGLPEALAFFRGAATPGELRALESGLFGLDRKIERKLEKKRITRKQLRPVEYFQRLEECEAVMADWRNTDQVKVMRLLELLVPDILSEKAFISKIWNLDRPVTSLKVNELRRINNTLYNLKHQPKTNGKADES